MIKVALLSRWHVHANDYVRQIKANDNMSIEVIWDEEVERGKEWATELSVPFEQDLEVVLSNPYIDAVIVNTPTSMHKEIIIAAAMNGKHIFTEKILTFTVKDCKDIYEAVESAKVKLMVSLPRLTDNNFLYAEKVLRENWIGKLTTIRCRLAHNGIVSSNEKGGWLPEHFLNKGQTGGGAMIDLGAHPIYLTNRLAGKPKALYAKFQSINSTEVDDNSALLVEYESGALGVIETSFVSSGSPFQLDLYGTKGTLFINGDDIKVKSDNINGGELTDLTEKIPSLLMPMEQWVEAIKDDYIPTITKEDVMNLTLINEAASKSSLDGCRIELQEIIV